MLRIAVFISTFLSLSICVAQVPASTTIETCNNPGPDMLSFGGRQLTGATGRMEVTVYGNGKIGEIKFPDAINPLSPHEFAFSDYTHLYGLGGVSMVRTGEYYAEILPPGRNTFLIPEEPEFDSGITGAVILRMKNPSKNDVPLVLYAPRNPTNLTRLPTLTMAPADLDLLIGWMTSIRTEVQFILAWSSYSEVLTDECRPEVFKTFNVNVQIGRPQFFRKFRKPYFGASVKNIPTEQQGKAPLGELIDDPGLRIAQATAGYSALDYLQRIMWIEPKLDAALKDLNAIKSSRLSITQKQDQLKSLKPAVADTIAFSGNLLAGLRVDTKNPSFKKRGDWDKLIEELEAVDSELRYFDTNEQSSLLRGGEFLSNAVLVSAPKTSDSIVTPDCILDVIKRPILAQIKIGDFSLNLGGTAASWFSRVGTNEYALSGAAYFNAEEIRKLHREIAKRGLPKSSCGTRVRLRETDQSVNSLGHVVLKANVRHEQHVCTTIKYPCGIGKSCKKTMSTKLFSATAPVWRSIKSSLAGDRLHFEADGQVTMLNPAEVLPGYEQLLEQTGLKPVDVGFVNSQGTLWHQTQLRGSVPLSSSFACAIASSISSTAGVQR